MDELTYFASNRPFVTTGTPARSKSSALEALFSARFERLQGLRAEWEAHCTPLDWHVRLVHKALFSTWADLRELSDAARRDQSGDTLARQRREESRN